MLWALLYSQLEPFSRGLVAVLGIPEGTRLHEAVAFFVYDTPKVLLLLVLVVFAMGVVRSFFSPEHTRAPAGRPARGRRQCAGRILGIVTPFCSCSAVPLFIGFVSAGVPLGVTFSFLIAAPMVNEVALACCSAVRLAGGAGVSRSRPWRRDRRRLDHRAAAAGALARGLGARDARRRRRDCSRSARPGRADHAGLDAVREIVGRVWH